MYYNMTVQLKLTKIFFKRKSQTHVSLILLVNNLLDSITLTLILESILFIPMQKEIVIEIPQHAWELSVDDKINDLYKQELYLCLFFDTCIMVLRTRGNH